MNNLIAVNSNGVLYRMVLSNHIDLYNTCGTYATAKHLKNQGFSLDYALACLSKSKYAK
jgi:hypothetical protein